MAVLLVPRRPVAKPSPPAPAQNRPCRRRCAAGFGASRGSSLARRRYAMPHAPANFVRLLSLLGTDPDAGLRYAIPLHSIGPRGLARPAIASLCGRPTITRIPSVGASPPTRGISMPTLAQSPDRRIPPLGDARTPARAHSPRRLHFREPPRGLFGRRQCPAAGPSLPGGLCPLPGSPQKIDGRRERVLKTPACSRKPLKSTSKLLSSKKPATSIPGSKTPRARNDAFSLAVDRAKGNGKYREAGRLLERGAFIALTRPWPPSAPAGRTRPRLRSVSVIISSCWAVTLARECASGDSRAVSRSPARSHGFLCADSRPNSPPAIPTTPPGERRRYPRVFTGQRLPTCDRAEASSLTSSIMRLDPGDRLLARDCNRFVSSLTPAPKNKIEPQNQPRALLPPRG